MALINVGGTDLPAPSDFNVGIQDISKADRNANGDMIIERIATKRKLELSWSYLTKSQLSTVLSAVSPVLFTVIYPDPQTGATRTGTFYSGDRNCGMLRFINGVPEYKDVKFNLIER
jgi:hypothetical protein